MPCHKIYRGNRYGNRFQQYLTGPFQPHPPVRLALDQRHMPPGPKTSSACRFFVGIVMPLIHAHPSEGRD